jgi:peptide/nickel transport system permease protein
MRFLGRRLLFYAVAAWAAVTLNFVLPRLMPGNPAAILIARFRGRLTPVALHSLEVMFGLDRRQSLPLQYVHYLGQMLRGQFGTSIAFFPEPVRTVIGEALPWTLFLVGLSTVISFLAGTLLGVWSAWRRGSLLDALLPTASTLLSAFPYFWLAMVLLYLLAFRLGAFPTMHAYGRPPAWTLRSALDILDHAALPAGTIVLSSVGGWLLSMRNNLIAVLGEDYMVMARAKGLPVRRIVFSYAARNAILPNFTSFALSLGFVVGGALLTEVVFSYPGLGFTLFQAVESEDYPLMQAIFLIIALSVLLANLLADGVYALLDPRVRQQEG